MTSLDLTTYVTFGYLACAVLGLVGFVAGKENSALRRAPFVLLIILWIAHTAAIGLRWHESYEMGIGRVPLSNLYESLVFFAWSFALAVILVVWRFKLDLLAVVGVPLIFLIMGSTFLVDPDIEPLIPALQSNWLAAHVITCFLGYAGFAVSFVAAALLLILGGSAEAPGRLNRTILDEVVYRSILVGFPMLTIGIITGAAWADYAWGSYWSWDPKETWSLITWLVYAGFLHARLAGGWTGTRTAVLSLVGFAAVLFTYFGVNYLSGLHAYL